MKECVHCKETKPDSEFAWNNRLLGRKQKHCRDCMAKFNRQSYERRSEERKEQVRKDKFARIAEGRQYVWDYLSSHPCVDCGEADPRKLEFDHVKGNKRMPISSMVAGGHSIKSLQKEIGKCVVRCANCHRVKTYEERGWFSG